MVRRIVTEVPIGPSNVHATVDGMAATQNRPVNADEQINLHDGTDAVVRPISPADAGALLRFHGRLSAGSMRLRYFYPHKNLTLREVTYLGLPA